MLLVATVLSAGLLLAGCGSETSSGTGSNSQGGVAVPSKDSSSQIQRVISTDKVFAVDDVVNAGFKKSKTYDVTGLEKATAA
ncbi:MAG: hypothetical protein HY678_03590, partial [Chloroflexi bacterium]|nr:hypothetical protein [Chloroflexota bacterium]